MRQLSALLVSTCAASALLSASALGQTFTVIGLPDTQNYSELYPEIFANQTEWVANNIDALNIQYVSHYGDLVQNADQQYQWNNADAAMANLDALGDPYGVCAGNHDITQSGSSGQPYIPSLYLQTFGPQRFADDAWYRGASPSGMSSYIVVPYGGIEWLFLHVESDNPLRELEWAQGVLDANRDKPCLFTTHRYLQDAEDYTFGVPVVPSGRYPDIWYAIEGTYTPDGIQAEECWDWFIRRNPTIFMVNCGHFHEEYRQTSTNAYGNPVREILADYQDDPNGGNGWLRIMTFDMGQNQILFESYSPWLDQYRTADESLFTLPVTFENYRESEPTVVLQEGINGYFGTQDTWINQNAPGTSYGDDDFRVSDDDTGNSLFSDGLGQALVRFDDLISPTRVPAGAQIAEAWLSLQLKDDVDQPFSSPDFYLHRVFVPWDEGSTWSSLGNGLSGGEVSGILSTITGDNDPDSDGLRRLNVTSSVQAWANGEPNWGWAILPEIVSGNDDGAEIWTSENANALFRPRLEVVFESDCGYSTYGSVFGVNAMSISGSGVPKVGNLLDIVTTSAPLTGVFTALAFAPSATPLFGGTIHLDLSQLDSLTYAPSEAGTARLSVNVPNDVALIGAEGFFQSLGVDAAQPEGLVLSNGLRAKLCL
jgi:hypothetical protein